jgi:hypothetical protein
MSKKPQKENFSLQENTPQASHFHSVKNCSCSGIGKPHPTPPKPTPPVPPVPPTPISGSDLTILIKRVIDMNYFDFDWTDYEKTYPLEYPKLLVFIKWLNDNTLDGFIFNDIAMELRQIFPILNNDERNEIVDFTCKLYSHGKPYTFITKIYQIIIRFLKTLIFPYS